MNIKTKAEVEQPIDEKRAAREQFVDALSAYYDACGIKAHRQAAEETLRQVAGWAQNTQVLHEDSVRALMAFA